MQITIAVKVCGEHSEGIPAMPGAPGSHPPKRAGGDFLIYVAPGKRLFSMNLWIMALEGLVDV